MNALDWIAWRRADLELYRWRRAGKAAVWWWRDDDAREPSPSLDRLINLSRRFMVPVALAIIPDRSSAPLAARLAREDLVSPIQHGCDHVDRARDGEPSCEFPKDASPVEIAAAINVAWRRLAANMTPVPLYAPPWNLAPPNIAQALALTPLMRLSLYGEDNVEGVQNLNAHIDVMRWRPARFRGAAPILSRLLKLLRARRLAGRWTAPIGILTHHRNLDPQAWAFLELFLAWSVHHAPVMEWRSARELVLSDQLEADFHPG